MNFSLPPRWLSDNNPDLHPLTDLAMSRAIISDFTPGDEAQAIHRADVLDFIDDHPDALHRSCLIGHLTASAWVVDHSGRRGLIMYHSKIRRWVQPGGHADGDANLAAVALKEATEETGIAGLEVWSVPIDVDIHLFVNRKQAEPDHLHHDLRFLVRAPQGAVERGNEESEALRWITAEETLDPALDLDTSTIRLARSGFTVAATVA
jgi:8-oxo-dGTP pyrophosphatase MutT (NUDIX family)